MHCRHEIIKTARFLMCTCIDTILSHTFINVVFLMMYGAMWSLGMSFDTGVFAICFVILNYTRQPTLNSFNYAVRDMVNYMAAQRRIRVRERKHRKRLVLVTMFQAFLLLDDSERDKRLLPASSATMPTENDTDIPQVICSIKLAQWDTVRYPRATSIRKKLVSFLG